MTPYQVSQLMFHAASYYDSCPKEVYDKLDGMRYVTRFMKSNFDIDLSQRQAKWAMEYAYTMMES